MIQSQSIRIATAVLFILGSLKAASATKFYSHYSEQDNSSQAEPKNKHPSPPAILPGHSGSIRRGVCRGEAIRTAEPIYPAEAEKQGLNGVVVVEIIINEKGHVKSSRSLSGPDSLKEPAEEAAKKWRFRATRIGGKPVKVACTLSFTFPPVDSKGKSTLKR
jgi:TonB family protein